MARDKIEALRAHRCGNCEHFAEQVFGILPPTCRINPPGVLPTPTSQGLQVTGMWPPTDEKYWCGKWEAQKVVQNNIGSN